MTQQETPTAYQPDQLLDALRHMLHLHSDEALSRRLHVAPRIIREIRAGVRPIGASMLMWMSEVAGVGIPELRKLMGDRRRTCRLSYGGAKLRKQAAGPSLPPRGDSTQEHARP